jgi:predicted HD phosphohydrolase
LHDIGHLLDLPESRRHPGVGVINHAETGSRFLETLGFGGKVCELVRSHVEAKRYLASKGDYEAKLSPASKTTLRLQGGPMSPEEAERWGGTVHSFGALRLRVHDEAAKVPGMDVPGWEAYRPLIEAHLSALPSQQG